MDRPTPAEPPGPIVQLSTRPVYRNRWIDVREDVVRFPNGHEGIYGVVTTPGAVGVLPFVDATSVLLVAQYRYVAGRVTLEMPTGAPEPGESASDTAVRELAEETGMRAAHLEPLGSFHTSKSVVDETAHLFLARGLTPADGSPMDVTEEISTVVLPFVDVLERVLSSEIVDSMTVIGVLRAARLLGA